MGCCSSQIYFSSCLIVSSRVFSKWMFVWQIFWGWYAWGYFFHPCILMAILLNKEFQGLMSISACWVFLTGVGVRVLLPFLSATLCCFSPRSLIDGSKKFVSILCKYRLSLVYYFCLLKLLPILSLLYLASVFPAFLLHLLFLCPFLVSSERTLGSFSLLTHSLAVLISFWSFKKFFSYCILHI